MLKKYPVKRISPRDIYYILIANPEIVIVTLFLNQIHIVLVVSSKMFLQKVL